MGAVDIVFNQVRATLVCSKCRKKQTTAFAFNALDEAGRECIKVEFVHWCEVKDGD